MADDAVEMKLTLGLTGLTMNEMALIVRRFLADVLFRQPPATAPAMDQIVAVAACPAAVCHAEMANSQPVFVLLLLNSRS
jgi:hypothetical protein